MTLESRCGETRFGSLLRTLNHFEGTGERMATRLQRLHEFSQAEPPADEAVELLCEDHSGTYIIPSLCRWTEGRWVTAELGTLITSKVVGWRAPRGYRGR